MSIKQVNHSTRHNSIRRNNTRYNNTRHNSRRHNSTRRISITSPSLRALVLSRPLCMRLWCLLLLVPLLLTTACGPMSQAVFDIGTVDYYTAIPGVTPAEIDAIEALKADRNGFTYGVLIGTELYTLPDGTYEGFADEFCALLTTLFGIPFEPTLYDNWDVLKNEHGTAAIDFMGELCPTPERMAVYQMTNPIAEHALRIFTLTDAPVLSKESDVEHYNIGFLANTITADYIKKAYPLDFTVVEVDSYEAAVPKLRSGEIDAFVEDADADPFFLDYSDIQSKKFFSMVYSPIAMSTANNTFAPIISVMNKYLSAGGVDWLLAMYKESEINYAKYKLSRVLTEEEKAYLRTAADRPVALALENDNYPVSFYNASEREFQGIAVDILHQIANISGLSFEVVTEENTKWSDMLETLRSGRAAMVSQLLYTEERKADFLWSDAPYSLSYYALLSRVDYPDLSNFQVTRAKVGTLRNTAHEYVFYEWFPEHTNTRQYETQDESVNALDTGEIDLLMASAFLQLSQTNYHENSGLKINILLSTPMESYFGFNKNEAVLCSIISKVQSYVDTGAIEHEWTSRSFDYQKKVATERVNYFMLFSSALVLVLIFTMTLFFKNIRLTNNLSRLVEERTQELAHQTNKLATIYTAIPDIVFSMDTDLRYTSCNPSFEKFTGVSQGAALGQRDEDILANKADAAYFTQANQGVLDRRETLLFEENVTYPDGTQVVLETVKTPLFQNGTLIGLLGIARNITERKSADARAKLMLEATPLCCSLIDKNFTVIDCNQQAVQLFGFRDKEEYKARFLELFPPRQPGGEESVALALAHVNEAFKRGRLVIEWMHQKPDGTPVPGEVTLVRVMRDNESVLAVYTRDQREQKKMLDEINHKDHLLQTVNNAASILLQSDIAEFENNLLRCMGMMAGAVRADRVYIWKNHVKDGQLYCHQLYEWSMTVEPQQGKHFTLAAAYSETVPGWEKKLSQGQCINSLVRDLSLTEQATLSPQGIVSILVVPVFLRDTFWGFVGFDDCRQERLFSDDEVTVLRSGSIMIASAFLRNEMTLAIQAAVKTAQDASQAKSNFLSNMSHEIRTPLNAITGMTQIGKAAPDAKKKDYAFGKIEDASSHLLGVINDILDMSKIEANKLTLSAEAFPVEGMLQKVVNVINFRIHEKKQPFAVYVADNVPPVIVGDSQRLAQVITNLLSNAVKFTPEGGSIRLDVGLLKEEAGVCTLKVAVTDAGIGIDARRQATIFDPFEQADNQIARKFGGTGLGLSISKYIVEAMGGEIWVESAPGQGSTFAFTIQAARGAEADAEKGAETEAETGADFVFPQQQRIQQQHLQQQRIQQQHLQQQHLQQQRILIAESDPEACAYFANILRRLGLACETAASGEEALARVGGDGGVNSDVGDRGNNNYNYDIVFVDGHLPGMGGIALAGELKRRKAADTVIMTISAYDWTAMEEAALAAGVDRFLSKPLFLSAVADCLAAFLSPPGDAETGDEPGEQLSFSGYRMLLVEDLAVNRDIVMLSLAHTAIEIDCAENGAEALRMFSAAPDRYQLIFMDVQMPEMDGLEATRRIRALGTPQAESIPIVAMTANVFREDVVRCKEAGMNDHVGKPLDMADVLQKMKRYLWGV